MIKRTKRAALAVVALMMTGLTACGPSGETKSPSGEAPGAVETRNYTRSEAALNNPLMGFAPQANDPDTVGDHTLVYLEVLWKDIEPQEGVFDFSVIEEKNTLSKWREAGKHVVLRFISDKPSKEPHMDIPQWLYDKTKDGTHYAYDDTHKGYSPDYNNTTLIEAHRKAIAALGEHFGKDTFVSFVELGSLGHWGEWHVNYESGIVRMPKEAVREQYVTPYLNAFPHAKFLMRRPFNTAAKYGFGLYDDTAGNPVATEDWLEWIRSGGDYSQAEEKNALTPMVDAWKKSPIGGEFNSDLTMPEMLTTGLNTTLSLLQQSHTTFLGPNFPSGSSEKNGKGCESGIDAVRRTMGYRLWVKQAAYTAPKEGLDGSLKLTWSNSGVAPMYWDWPVYLYFYDGQQNLLGKYPVDIKTTQLLPEQELSSTTTLKKNSLTDSAAFICVGIEDPMINQPAVSLAMEAQAIGKTTVLYQK